MTGITQRAGYLIKTTTGRQACLAINLATAPGAADHSKGDQVISRQENGALAILVHWVPGKPVATGLDTETAVFDSLPVDIALSFACRFVEAHGGRLWATSNEPRGAIFFVMLPIGEKSLENPESSQA